VAAILPRDRRTVGLAAGVWIEECLTDMISPAAFEALNLPVLIKPVERVARYRRLVDRLGGIRAP